MSNIIGLSLIDKNMKAVKSDDVVALIDNWNKCFFQRFILEEYSGSREGESVPDYDPDIREAPLEKLREILVSKILIWKGLERGIGEI